MKSARERPFVWRFTSPLAWLYGTGVRLKNFAHDRGFLKQRRLSWPVVSVGNLSVGGTGKTPVVMLLGRLLEARGWDVDVLSRGYGRKGQNVLRVDPSGTADLFGDEPLLMARRGIPVYVGADRYQVGLLAEQHSGESQRPGTKVHILDDGFQHRRLHRTVDIVMLQRADLEDEMLPSGRLREPSSALKRADVCVLRSEDADLKQRVLRRMGQTDSDRVWIIERRIVLPTPLNDSSSSIRKGLAFCAIGDPRGFFDSLRHAGMNVTQAIAFRDHHTYTLDDIDRLKADAERSGAQCFFTTEKDRVRLDPALCLSLEKVRSLIVAGLEVTLHEEARCMATLESLLAKRKTAPLQFEQHNVR